MNYWLVGATWAGHDQKNDFYNRGYWEMGYNDNDKPNFAKKRDNIKKGDRIAVKSMDGKGATTITIHSFGIVKDVADKKVYVDWILKDLNRKVESRGAFATIHGPYNYEDDWTNKVFCI